MPTYEITSPDGRTFEVTAPEGATKEQVLGYARSQIKGQIDPSKVRGPQGQPAFLGINSEGDTDFLYQPYSNLASFAMGATQGPTFGMTDELMALTDSLPNYKQRKFAGYSDRLGENLVKYDEMYDQAREDNPLSYGLGEVGSAVVTGGAAAKGFTKLAPEAVSALTRFAATHPYAASSGIGGVSGGLYGFGNADGPAEDRLDDAATTGAFGAVAGPAVTLGLRKMVGPAIERGSSALARVAGNFDDKVDDLVPETAPQDFNALEKPSGQIFSKTLGERTQKADIQTLESDAMGGRYGTEASSKIRNARSIQNQERKAFISVLSKEAQNPDEVNDVLSRVYERVSANEKALGKSVDNAYELARGTSKGKGIMPVRIKTADIEDGLTGQVAKITKEMGINLADSQNYSKSNAVLQNLAQRMKTPKGKERASLKLEDLEDWRKTLTNYANDATGTEKAYLSKIRNSYDEFMYKTANEAVDIGDKEAILAFRDAVSLRRQYGQLFEKNKITQSIAEGKTVDDFVKDLVGTGAIAGKKGMMDNVQALVKAGGDDPLVKEDLAGAFAKRLYKRSIEGFEEGRPESSFVSATKMKTGLEELFVKNKELAKFLYGDDAIKAANQAIKELELISKKQPATQNPSGSGYVVARILRSAGITRVPGLSLINDAIESAGKVKGQANLDKALDEFFTQPKSSLFTVTGGTIGGVGSSAAIKATE